MDRFLTITRKHETILFKKLGTQVRTPLNSVSMGLALLLEEIQVVYMQYQLKHEGNNEMDSNSERTLKRRNLPQQPDITTTGTVNLNSSTISQMPSAPQRSVAIRRKSMNWCSSQISHDDIMKCDSKKLMDWLLLTTEVTDNLQAAADVLNDLLNYDKIESGILHLELSILSLWEILDRTAHEFKGAVTQKKIQYDVHIVQETPTVDANVSTNENTGATTTTAPNSSLASKAPNNTDSSVIGARLDAKEQKQPSTIINCCNGSSVVSIGDAVRLTQCFRNLLSNALKFTPENGTSPR